MTDDYAQYGVPTGTQDPYAGFGAPTVQVPGANPATDAKIQQHFESTIGAAAKANVDAEGNPKPFSFTDAIEAGWQQSVAGLQMRGKVPDKQLPGDASQMQRLAANVSSLAGDFPFMTLGAGMGFVAGIPGGPPGIAVGAASGAFGLPAGLRAAMMDSYKNGEYKSPMDYLERASGIMMETTKGLVTGAFTAATGSLTESAVAGAGAITKAATPTAAELATMVTVMKGLEAHIPSWQDFQDGALIMFGLKGATGGADKLMDIYKKTGVTPTQIHEDMNSNPTIQPELNSAAEVPTAYQKFIDPMFQKAKEVAKAYVEDDSGALNLTAVQQAAKNIKAKIAVNPEEPAKAGYSFDRFYTDWVDNLDPVKRIVDAVKNGGTNVPASEDPYKLMRNSRGGYERANQFITDATVDFNSYKPNGDSLAKVIEPVKEDLNGLRTFMVARRAVELEARGVNSGFDVNEAKLVSEDPAQKAKYEAVAQGVTEYSNRVTQYARDAGLLDQKTFDLFMEMNKNYVPFNRVLPDEEQTKINSPSGQQARSPFKSVKGSDKDVIDPIQSLIQNTYTILTLAERNHAMTKLVDTADKAGLVGAGTLFEKVNPRIKGTTVSDKEMTQFLDQNGIKGVPQDQLTVFRALRQPLAADEIAVYRDGKREVYALGDAELVTALKGMPSELSGPLWNFVTGFTRFFRAGTILNPDFLPRHIVRQNINAFINSETGLLPVVSALRGASDMFGDKNGELLQQWRSGGGMNSEITAWDRRYIQNSVADIEGGRSLAEFIQDTKDDPKSLISLPYNSAQSVLDLAHMAIAGHDNFIRFEEFKNSMAALRKQGVTGKDAIIESAFRSREVLLDNFRRGARMQAINQVWAFSNLRIQGGDKLARLFKEQPDRTAIRLSALVAIPTMLLWWANHDDPRYGEIADWMRDNFWIIFTDDWRAPKPGEATPDLPGMSRVINGDTQYNFGSTLRITKPQESGLLFGSSLERFLDFSQKKDPKTAIKLGVSLWDALVPELSPSIATPIIEQFANKSMFTGGPIVPSNAENILPAYQYTNYTTETTKALGKIIGTIPGMQNAEVGSPAIIENYVRQWSGGLGIYTLQLADYGLRKAGIVNDPVRPSSTMADIPFIRAFVARYPSANTQTIEDFYTQFDNLKKVHDTVNWLAAKGDFQAASTLAETNPLAMANLDNMRAAMANQQKFIQFVYDNPDWKPAEKRQLIDGAYYQMIGIAHLGNDTMKEMAASLDKAN